MITRMCIECFSNPRRRRQGTRRCSPYDVIVLIERQTAFVDTMPRTFRFNPTHKSSEIDLSHDARLIMAACLSYTLLYDTLNGVLLLLGQLEASSEMPIARAGDPVASIGIARRPLRAIRNKGEMEGERDVG